MLLALLRPTSGADPAGGSTYAFVPATISADGQRLLAKIGRDRTAIPTLPEPGDHTGWARLQAAATSAREVDLGALETQGVAVSRVEIGDAAYFDLRPRGLADDGSTIVYLHGGAFVYFDARGSLAGMAKLARAFGRRVIVVDYRLAPAAKWPQITGDVVAVMRSLLAAGSQMRRIAIFGEFRRRQSRDRDDAENARPGPRPAGGGGDMVARRRFPQRRRHARDAARRRSHHGL